MFSWPTLELSFLNLPLSRFVHAPDRALTPRRGRGHPGSPGETEAARPAPREPRSCGRSRARHGRARWASAPPLVRRQSPPSANAHGGIAGFPAHERIAYHKIPRPNPLSHGRARRAFVEAVRISGPTVVIATECTK